MKKQPSINVVSLDTIKNVDEDMIGIKTMSLCRMSQIGLKVPFGFCIMATAFRQYLEANELIGKVESALDKLNLASLLERKLHVKVPES